MALTIWNYANAPLALLLIAAVFRWGWKIDRGLTDSVKAAELLRVRIEAHETLDDVRFEDTSRRLTSLESWQR